jgi:hypothetical protein
LFTSSVYLNFVKVVVAVIGRAKCRVVAPSSDRRHFFLQNVGTVIHGVLATFFSNIFLSVLCITRRPSK